MEITLLGLIIVGAIAGTAAASVLGLRKTKKGRNWLLNTLIGILGAFVGTVVFDLLDINLGDPFNETITIAQVITAFVGAVIVIAIASAIDR